MGEDDLLPVGVRDGLPGMLLSTLVGEERNDDSEELGVFLGEESWPASICSSETGMRSTAREGLSYVTKCE